MTRAERIEEAARALVDSWDEPRPSQPYVDALRRALAEHAPVEAHGDAPDGYCPKCRADICAQLAAAYDAGRESVEVAAALAPKCGSEQDDEDTYRRRVAQPAATGEGECPDCNDGVLTRAFAVPHDIPCPTCAGTMRAPPLAPVPSGPREGEKP